MNNQQETPQEDTQKEFGQVININAKEEENAKKEPLTADGKKVLPYITLNILPVAKPRMTQSDKWKKRPATEKYWRYKEDLKLLCFLCRWIPQENLCVQFILPMPKSWSETKKKKMDGQPHKQRPDLDNLIKGFKDALLIEDSHIHSYDTMKKIWGREGQIILKR